MARDRHSWLVEEINSVLAADLNTNLSGLGIGSESSAYNMSEAISALQCIKTEDLQIAVQSKEPVKSPLSEEKDTPRKNLAESTVQCETTVTDFSKALKKFCVSPDKKTDIHDQMNERASEKSQAVSGMSQFDLTYESAPLVPNIMSAVRPGLTMKESGEKRIIQCVLGAPTALGINIGEETLTYLNQGDYCQTLASINHVISILSEDKQKCKKTI
ncbi:uncharacterized protein LOC111087087 [Limulus polyphemus]|uniref:Uncharacterized protein LOC111087087 n=1 Tax=Limulus polyphemus TaxID=6850 RepID=A0ABM1SWZ8_LIMPO|nr:uncharacterized protein LOC111087087 [Limulus polyphemus]XP_022248156.1 uncharacterized protein LOC111087087 [Limulus polyphemus]XP_022248157.1 uncharacterized protein LOC111087087 [Limulus polyphemus]XP_022248158.1 uncharacterized protein LOC111087087 [Limulus polyphemus]